ncbi:MFS transporter [Streptomyces violascens]|uniref:MFS transporter n=1 Tax=Streptomyces violascens TaxID=67381 RepID=UPI00364899C2
MNGFTGALRRVADSYALPSREGRVVALAVAVYAAGSGLYLAGGTVFFVSGIGLSIAEVGTGLTIAGLVGFLTTVPVSMLAKRLGALRLLRMLQVWRAFWFVALAFADTAVTFTLFASLFAMSQGPVSPMTQLVVSTIAGEADRTRSFAVMRSVSNVGMSVGALAAAPFLAVGSAWTFKTILLIGGLSCLGAALLLGRINVTTGAPEAKRVPWRSGLAAVCRDRRYAALTAANGVLFLHTVLLGVGLPLWAVRSTNAPAGMLSVLVTVNTVLAIALQVHFAERVNTSQDGTRALRNAGFALAAFSLVLIASSHCGTWLAMGLLLVATVLLTCGELWQSAGSWGLSYRHAPEEQRTEYLSVFSLGSAAVGIVGPALLALVVDGGAAWLLGLAMLFLLTSAAVVAIGGRLARAERQERSAGEQVLAGK